MTSVRDDFNRWAESEGYRLPQAGERDATISQMFYVWKAAHETYGSKGQTVDELFAAAEVMAGGESLEDDHPLWLINEQIKGLLEGDGASEDHENVVQFLLSTGLPRSTVDRIHHAIVYGDIKTFPTAIYVKASS